MRAAIIDARYPLLRRRACDGTREMVDCRSLSIEVLNHIARSWRYGDEAVDNRPISPTSLVFPGFEYNQRY